MCGADVRILAHRPASIVRRANLAAGGIICCPAEPQKPPTAQGQASLGVHQVSPSVGLEPTFAPPAATSIYHIDFTMLLRLGKTCPTRPCRQSRRNRRYRHALISLNYLDTSTRCSALWRRMTGMLVPGQNGGNGHQVENGKSLCWKIEHGMHAPHTTRCTLATTDFGDRGCAFPAATSRRTILATRRNRRASAGGRHTQPQYRCRRRNRDRM